MMEMRNTYKVKREVGRCKHRWKDGVKIDCKGTGYEAVDRIHLAQDRY
jgi:hypothetical protein